jgi:hypothetical protein|tara:strand:+ start:155 stop:343 length:189 start_codon:yes stop_codon:yes gene_type:complete
MSSNIPSTKGPNLTNPSQEYNEGQELQLVNQLRLYFNQIDGNNNQVKESVDALATLNWLGDN